MRNNFLFVFFLAVISAILFGANLVIYNALALIFGISSASTLFLLGSALAVLSGGFIVFSAVSMHFYNAFTRIGYSITAAWLGFSGYLFFASIAYGILIAVIPDTIAGIPSIAFGRVFFAAAFLAAAYGVAHARRVVVKEIAVLLPNLPATWEGKTLAAVSDLHLGPVHASGSVRRVTQALSRLSPDMVAIVGDLFDGCLMPNMEKLLAPIRTIPAPLGVFFVTGNHEEFADKSRFLAPIESAGIRILRDERIDVAGMQIIGVSHHSSAKKEEFQKILAGLGIRKDAPSILLKHEPRDMDVARDAGISFQISGHTHAGQQWPFGYIARIVYKRFSYGLASLGTLSSCTMSGVGTWGPPLRVGTDSEIILFRFVSRS